MMSVLKCDKDAVVVDVASQNSVSSTLELPGYPPKAAAASDTPAAVQPP